jgi:hypothetical protein
MAHTKKGWEWWKKGKDICEYCKVTKNKRIPLSAEHVARCRSDTNTLKETLEKCTLTAHKWGEPGLKKEEGWTSLEQKAQALRLIYCLPFEQQDNEMMIILKPGKAVVAPSRKDLERAARAFLDNISLKDRRDHRTEVWKAAILKTMQETDRKGKGNTITMNKTEWKWVITLTRADTQINTNILEKNELLKHHIHPQGTDKFGSREMGKPEGTIEVADSRDTDRILKDQQKMRDMFPGIWTTIITRNSAKQKKILQKAGYVVWGQLSKGKVAVASRTDKTGEIQDADELAERLHLIQIWNDKNKAKGNKISGETFKLLATPKIRKLDWKETRKAVISKAMKWMEKPERIMGIGTDADIMKLTKVGICENKARKIVRHAEEKLFEVYVKDQVSKTTTVQEMKERNLINRQKKKAQEIRNKLKQKIERPKNDRDKTEKRGRKKESRAAKTPKKRTPTKRPRDTAAHRKREQEEKQKRKDEETMTRNKEREKRRQMRKRQRDNSYDTDKERKKRNG